MKLYYLAHPVTGDEHYTYEENVSHVMKIARIFYDNEIYVDIPWFPMIHFLDNNNPDHLRIGLEIDCKIAAERDGILLTGHRLSRGMSREKNAALEADKRAYDFIGVPDEHLAEEIERMMKHGSSD